MIKFNAKFFSGVFFISILFLSLGLLSGFLMDYFHGRNFGMVLLAIDLTDKQKFAALVASFFAFFLFSKKKAKVPPQVGLSFRYPFKALTSLLIMGFDAGS